MEQAVARDAIVVDRLSKHRDGFALRDVSLTVPVGFITGLVGPNGAGKTTLIRSMLGLLTPDSGSVRVLGARPSASPEVRDRIGVVLDRVNAAPEWRVGSIGRRVHGLYRRWSDQAWSELLERFELPAHNRVNTLSRGQTVKLSLAMALAHDPQLLILDEPTSGLDPVARRELAGLLREFMLQPDHTILFSTHITAELDDLADHIVVLNAGEIAFAGMLDDLHTEFAIVRGAPPLPAGAESSFIGLQRDSSGGYEALIHAGDTARFGPEVVIDSPTTDDVVVHFAEEARA